MKYEFKTQKNDGKEVIVTVTAKNGKVKTLRQGKTYTLDGLIELAANGEISEDTAKDNEALAGVSQDTAKEWLQAAVSLKSVYLEITVAEVVAEVVADKAENPKK